MKIHQYVCNGKIGDSAEEEFYKEIIEELSRCTSDIEIWTIANVELSNTQIDLMIIKRDGILCIDFKNYKGNIIITENKVEIDGKTINEKNWFEQAKIQRKTAGKAIDRITKREGTYSEKWMYFQTRQLRCVHRGSAIDIREMDYKVIKWFGVITLNEICKEVKNYSSGSRKLTIEEIHRIIKGLNAEPWDHEEILKEISKSLPKNPSVSYNEIRKKDYKSIHNRLLEIHDNIADLHLKWECEYGMALTYKDARNTLNELLRLYNTYPQFRDYGNHNILEDIFEYYFEYIDYYEDDTLEKVERVFKDIKDNEIKYKIIKDSIHKAMEYGIYFIEDAIPEMYDIHPEDYDLGIETIKYYSRRGEEKGKILFEKFLFDIGIRKKLGITDFWDWGGYYYLGDVLKLYTCEEFFELLDRLKKEYRDISEAPERVICLYFFNMQNYLELHETAKLGLEKSTDVDSEEIYLYFLILSFFGLYSDNEGNIKNENLVELYDYLQQLISLDISDCSIYLTNYKVQQLLLSQRYKNIDIGVIERDLKKGIKKCGSKEMYYLLGHTCKEHDKECAIKQFKKVLDVIIAPDEFWIDFDDEEETDEPIPRFWRWKEILKEIKPERRKRKLDNIEKSCLTELINLYAELEQFKELYFIVEKLKEVAIVDEDLYSFSYKIFGKWLLNNYSQIDEEKEEIKKEKKILLEDVVLNEELREEIEGIIWDIKRKGKPESLIFYGPPGCGKTMLAEAIANEISFEFLRIKPSDILNKYIGESEKNIRSIFERAKNGSVVIFLDEMETYTYNRSNSEHPWEFTMQNEVMEQIDEILNLKIPVVLIGATNNIHMIDPALMRSGRFDNKILILPPGREERKSILIKKIEEFKDVETEYSLNMEEIDFEVLTKETDGMTGADIRTAIMKKLPRIMFKKRGKKIGTYEILEAIKKTKKDIFLELDSKGGGSRNSMYI